MTMIKASCKIPGFYSIINFGRKELEQTGTGHYACLGGYHPKSSKVLVMDTARFKYPPFWVDADQLYESVRSMDNDANKMRGFMMLSKSQKSLQSFEDRETSLLDVMNSSDTPKVKFMSDLSLK